MISYRTWKEEFDMNQIMQMFSPEQEKPALANFKSFIDDRSAPHREEAASGRMQMMKEFLGDLAGMTSAAQRIEHLNSHDAIREHLMHMNEKDWDALKDSLAGMANNNEILPKAHQKVGRALLWLHKEMRRFGTSYNRKTSNLSQYDASFRKSRSPKLEVDSH